MHAHNTIEAFQTAAYVKNKTINNSKHLIMAICQLCSMQLQREEKSNSKQSIAVKKAWLPRSMKKTMKSKVVAQKWL